MWCLTVAALLAVAKVLAWLGLGDVAHASHLSWGWVLALLLGNVVWWGWLDHSGRTGRRAQQAVAARKERRREALRVYLGTRRAIRRRR